LLVVVVAAQEEVVGVVLEVLELVQDYPFLLPEGMVTVITL
jgi:hypothetical protein